MTLRPWTRPPERSPAPRGYLLWLAAAAVAAVVLAAGILLARGGQWYIVRTPSMGPAAPVGSLVLAAPAGASPLRVGDIVCFHPPTVPAEIYTHRIVRIGADGITTRGDINGAEDGWRLRDADVVGRVFAVLPVAGTLVRALPVLVAGGVLLVLLTRLVRAPTRRASLRLVGASLLLFGVMAWLRPLLNVVLLTSVATPTGSRVQLVSTGVLPVRIDAPSGRFLELVAGQVGALQVPATEVPGRYALSSSLALPPWGWIALIGICCIPLLGSLLIGRPRDVPATPRRRHRLDQVLGPRHRLEQVLGPRHRLSAA